MTATLIENDLTVFEELEKDRVCTPWTAACDRSASWLLRSTCPCSVTIPICTPHKLEAYKQLQALVMDGADTMCLACRYEWKPLTYDDWWFEPL